MSASAGESADEPVPASVPAPRGLPHPVGFERHWVPLPSETSGMCPAVGKYFTDGDTLDAFVRRSFGPPVWLRIRVKDLYVPETAATDPVERWIGERALELMRRACGERQIGLVPAGDQMVQNRWLAWVRYQDPETGEVKDLTAEMERLRYTSDYVEYWRAQGVAGGTGPPAGG